MIYKISVLIPVYNVEQYIEKCAESLFKNTIANECEFIFTNDGSTDSSIQRLNTLIEKFPELKNNIVVLQHEKNMGLGATRNTGFDNAKGKYIICTDSDDWVEPDYLEKLFETAEKDASSLWKITVLAGVLAGVMIALSYPVVLWAGKLEAESARMLKWLIFSNSFSIIGAAVNTVFICGIFRAGGDARFGFKIDSITMWGVSVPLGLIAAFVLHLPPVIVYLILFCDEFEKMPFVIRHYRSRKWLMNITHDFNA